MNMQADNKNETHTYNEKYHTYHNTINVKLNSRNMVEVLMVLKATLQRKQVVSLLWLVAFVGSLHFEEEQFLHSLQQILL